MTNPITIIVITIIAITIIFITTIIILIWDVTGVSIVRQNLSFLTFDAVCLHCMMFEKLVQWQMVQ